MSFRTVGVALLLLSVAACSSSGQPSVANLAPASAKLPAILTAADATRAEGRFAEAMQIYQEILVSDPKSIATQYGVAECLLGLDKASDAKTMFDAISQTPEYRPRSLQGAGLAELALGQREEAAKSLRDAAEADPSLWRAWNGLGLIADMKQEPKEAETIYRRALTINPKSAILHNNLGYSRLLAGIPDEAIAELREAFSLDPSSETVQNNYRLALAVKGRYAEAIRGVVKKNLAIILNNVGYVAMQRGDLSAAEGYLARAMEVSPIFNTIASQNIEQLKAKKGESL